MREGNSRLQPTGAGNVPPWFLQRPSASNIQGPRLGIVRRDAGTGRKRIVAKIEDVGFVKRIVVGSLNPEQPASETESREKIALLNRCLAETPRGRIIGIEHPTTVVTSGDQQAIVQTVVYHVGFTRRPVWLAEISD
jgi:hypothetical protein